MAALYPTGGHATDRWTGQGLIIEGSAEELRERALRQATDDLITKAYERHAGSGEIKASWREEED